MRKKFDIFMKEHKEKSKNLSDKNKENEDYN